MYSLNKLKDNTLFYPTYFFKLHSHLCIIFYFIFSFISHVEGMNEDGSFIGLYGKNKISEISSTGFATLI